MELLLEHLGLKIYSNTEQDEEETASLFMGSVAGSQGTAEDAASVVDDQQVPVAFMHAFNELLATEKSYVTRIEALLNDYAIPLQNLAKRKDTEIIPPFEAQHIFGNISELVATNKMMLCELEALSDQNYGYVMANIGDVMYQNLQNFSCYEDFISDFDQAKSLYNGMLKNKAFRSFIENAQHSRTDLGNSGLRELMMEPLQRMPRYQLLMKNMIKRMPENSNQAQRLQEACATADFIASCHISDTTRRAAIMWSCGQHIDGFPAELVSPNRELVGCLDVADAAAEPKQQSVLSSIGATLTGGRMKRGLSPLYSLMLFDDIVVMVHRARGISAHQVIGVRDPNKLVAQMKKTAKHTSASKKELVFVGAIPLDDLRASGLDDTGVYFR